MTDDSKTYVSEAFNRWLRRYNPPKLMAGDDEAVQDEADALMRSVLAFAPKEGFRDWTGHALDALSEACQTRAWPTVAEVRKALKGMRYVPEGAAVSAKFDPVAINSDRMTKGEPVPERFLWGRWAKQMLEAGVSKQTLDQYRRSLHAGVFESRGEDAALQWADEVKSHHAADLQALRDEQAGRVDTHRGRKVIPQRIAAYEWE